MLKLAESIRATLSRRCASGNPYTRSKQALSMARRSCAAHGLHAPRCCASEVSCFGSCELDGRSEVEVAVVVVLQTYTGARFLLRPTWIARRHRAPRLVPVEPVVLIR